MLMKINKMIYILTLKSETKANKSASSIEHAQTCRKGGELPFPLQSTVRLCRDTGSAHCIVEAL